MLRIDLYYVEKNLFTMIQFTVHKYVNKDKNTLTDKLDLPKGLLPMSNSKGISRTASISNLILKVFQY